MTIKKQIITIIIALFIGWLLAYGVTEEVNPILAWKHCNLIIKGILLLIAIYVFLLLFGLIYMRFFLSEDAECARPDCPYPHNIRAYLPVVRKVVRCPICGRYFHKDCWRVVNGTEPTFREVIKGCKLHGGRETGRERFISRDDILYQSSWDDKY